MGNRIALVSCVHHKPWLMMSTLITALIQTRQDFDLHCVFNVGRGEVDRPSYEEYHRIADRVGANPQTSPPDERVRDVCRLRRPGVFEHEYENDHALDSGAWYKFIRDGHWRAYDYAIFAGEGTLFSRHSSLAGLVTFAEDRGVHFVASAHEKRRLPKNLFLRYSTRGGHATELDQFHDRMILETFLTFCRDPEFERVFSAWQSDFQPETQNHVPDVSSQSALVRRARASIGRRWGTPYEASERGVSWPVRVAQRAPLSADYLGARLGVLWNGARSLEHLADPAIVVDGRRARLADVVKTERAQGVRFHQVEGPEWFGCTTIHLMSRQFLERLHERLSAFAMYDVLDLPFSGTTLEVVWGMMPAWLGFDKWFTDGFHRVRKNFVTYVREDYPAEMAGYINRYYHGSVAVADSGDYLKIRAHRPDLSRLRDELPPVFF